MDWPLWLIAGIVIGAGAGAGVAAALARGRLRRSLARTREAVREAEKRAQSAERFAEIGAMTSGLAHEIKNPLSTIGLNAQLLSEAIDDLPVDRAAPADERQRLTRRVASLRREVERLRGILTDFLTYAGEVRLDQKPSDLNQLMDELADFYTPQAQRQGVRVRLDLATEPVRANVDAALVKQAVLNLILNAVQAMTAPSSGSASDASASGAVAVKGELILRVREVTEADGSRWATLSVIDTGPGIAPDVLPRIFQPYFTTKAGGSGLGLPTTRRLVEAHQGRVEVVSESGRGTAFTLSFPLLSGPTPAATQPASVLASVPEPVPAQVGTTIAASTTTPAA
jgi:signal transduction histidine kinase